MGDICDNDWSARALHLYGELSDFEYFDLITEINVSDKRNQYFIFSGKYKIALGDAHNLSEKLYLAMKIYHSEEFLDDSCAIIDASDEKKVILRYVSPEDLSK